jgi:hypothetical protein
MVVPGFSGFVDLVKAYALRQMGTIQRVTTLVTLLLTVSLSAAVQDKQSAYDDEMRKGEMLINIDGDGIVRARKSGYGWRPTTGSRERLSGR